MVLLILLNLRPLLSLLIVVGNPLLMAKDEHWGSLLKMCVERGGYEGTPLPEDLFEREAEDGAAAEEGAV